MPAGIEPGAGFSWRSLESQAGRVFGRRIHHREAPEAVAEGRADAAIVYYHLVLRYTRIFQDRFDILPLGGTETNPEPPPENLTAEIHMGLIRDGGPWGARLMAFMQAETVARIYSHHGLLHRHDIPRQATWIRVKSQK